MTKAPLILSILLFCFILNSRAQIENSRWKGIMHMENTVTIVWRFDKDTTQVFSQSDSTLFETMTYKVEPGILFIKKVSGISPCDTSTAGKYKFEIRDDKLYLTMIEDACQDRADAISSEPYIRIQ
jgi:hypothetical protein